MTSLNKIELNSSLGLCNKNQSLELSLLEDNEFDSPRSETSIMYIDKVRIIPKNINVISTV